MSKSRLEIYLDAAIEQSGLPTPRREYVFALPRRWRFDYCWPAYNVALEVEGGTWVRGRHTRGKGFEADCEKYAEAAIMGWAIIRVTGKMVMDGRALSLIVRALSANGVQVSDNLLTPTNHAIISDDSVIHHSRSRSNGMGSRLGLSIKHRHKSLGKESNESHTEVSQLAFSIDR